MSRRRLSAAKQLAAITVWAAASSWPVSTLAATGASGFTMAPFYQEVTIGQNQSQAVYSMTLTNNTDTSENFSLGTMNFGSLNNTGGVAFLGSSSSQFAQQHGLTSWMSLNDNSVMLSPGATSQIVVTIHNSSSLSVGGHYGAVLATVQGTGLPSSKSHVGVKQVLSSLILLDKAGGPPPNLVLVSQKTLGGTGAFGLPTATADSFQNEGDTHVSPRGLTVMKDPTGRVVMSGPLNIDSGVILPGMYRTYATPLDQLASAWLPGKYTLVTQYRYSATQAAKTYVTSFWYLGPFYAWVVILLVIVAATGWWYWQRRFRRKS